jgi:hypothetical protein
MAKFAISFGLPETASEFETKYNECEAANAARLANGAAETAVAPAKPVFGASPAASSAGAATSASPSRGGDTAGGETSHVDDSVFKLHGDASGLQRRVQIETGEEGSEVLFEARAKLRIFVESETYGDEERSNFWKERGKGQLKLLRNDDGTSTLLMRQESTEKVVANYIVVTTCAPAAGNPKARTVAGMDTERAVGAERKMAKFAISFGLPETASEFETKYNECEAANAARSASGASAASAAVAAPAKAAEAAPAFAFSAPAAAAPAPSTPFGGGAPAPSQIKVNAFASLASGSAPSASSAASGSGAVPCASPAAEASAYSDSVVRLCIVKMLAAKLELSDRVTTFAQVRVSVHLCTVTFHANLAHSLTRSP